MKKIAWFKKAIVDLDNIYNFYSLKNKETAINIHNSILDEIDRLKLFPEMAMPEPLFQDKELGVVYRSLVIKKGLFKVLYFVDGESVVIARIWVCRRNPADYRI